MKYVGKNIPRNDGFDKATGLGQFTMDVSMPHMLYARVLRSPYAHAKVVKIDTSAAEALPGVVTVCTFENTTNKPFNTSATMVTTPRPAEPVRDQTIFTDEPKNIGDEVAAVAAETEAIAAEAIKRIKVEYEVLPAVYDPVEALKPDSPEVQPLYGNKEHHNVCGEIVRVTFCEHEPYSDEALERGFAQADVIVDADIKLPRVKQCQMEVHAAVASYKANGTLEIISTTQTPTPTKMIVAYAFDLPESKVRVRNPPYLGGGFGVRIGISGKAELLAAALSMKALRPVKIVYSREEDFIASDTRHGGYMHARLGAKKDGTFVALDTTAKLNTGAYCTFGVELLAVCGVCGTAGTYHIPYLRYMGYPVYTNQQTAGAFRGFGTPQGTAVVEACVDKLAKVLDMDPIRLRKMNTMKPDDKNFFPFSVGSVGTNECLDKAAAEIGWYEKRGKVQTGNKRRGVGIACNTHVSNAAPFCVDYNAVNMIIEQDGSLRINTAIPEIGPGSTTALIQVACDLLGVPFETTTMIFGDSAAAPFDIGSHATRTLYSVSQVMEDAAAELKADILSYAAGKDFLDTDASALTLENGIISGNGKEMTLKALAYEAHLKGKQFLVSKCKVPDNSLPFAAQAAEVEVDMELGLVKVLKIAAAHDVGKVINPRLCEGQVEGGVLQGVGWAVREEMTYEEGKGFYNTGFHKYMLPTADDHPEIISILVESNDPKGTFGMKGIGEVGCIPTLPAIFSAVEDATGVRFEEAPLTPDRVLAGLKAAGKI